jgi:hypothetical protein
MILLRFCNAGCFFERFGLICLTEVARISAQNIIFDALDPKVLTQSLLVISLMSQKESPRSFKTIPLRYTRSQADPASLRQPPKQ